MNAEQWLADIEARADAATQGTWKADGGLMSPSAIFGDDTCIAQFLADNDAEYLVAANPLAVKRLVAMVKMMSLGASEYCPRPVTACRSDSDCSLCWLEAAYQQTEPKP